MHDCMQYLNTSHLKKIYTITQYNGVINRSLSEKEGKVVAHSWGNRVILDV